MNVSYFAIIPSNVRYDSDIPANAKLLYGELTALSNEKGYAWATNQYFAQLYQVHKNTISTWVSQLYKKGYITIEMVARKDGSTERRIGISPKIDTPTQKDVAPSTETGNPLNEKADHNNTVNTTPNKTDNNSLSPAGDEVAKPNYKETAQRIVAYLNEKSGKDFGTDTEVHLEGIIPKLKGGVTEEQFKMVVDWKCYEWMQPKQVERDMPKYLRPSTLFKPKKFYEYLEEAKMWKADAKAQAAVLSERERYAQLEQKTKGQNLFGELKND